MSRSLFLVLFYVTLSLFVSDEAARILVVIPTPSISHQVPFRPVTQELAKRGHEVVVITPDPAFPKGETPANLTEIDVHDISYNLWREFLTTTKGNKDDLSAQFKVGISLMSRVFEIQLQTYEVHTLINDKNKQFDLLILEACIRTTLALSHIYKVPVIQMSSFGAIFGNYETLGAPTHPLLYPSLLRQILNNLTLMDKISELYNYFKFYQAYLSHEEIENEMIRKHFGPDVPSLNELSNNVQMLFLNINPIFEGNYPVPPSVIHMGGLPEKPNKDLPQGYFPVPPSVVYLGGLPDRPEKDLPEEFQKYLDSSKNGVIYMSFGTNMQPSMLPPEKIQMIVKVFSQLPYDVLWKWDKEELPGKPKNIKIGKWFPQSDLLRHPKIKLFITQGGLQSTDEAISAGVPLVGVPMLGDQWFNVEKYVYHKIGVRLDMESLTAEEFRNAIETVIGDDSYRRNIVKLGALMRDQPQKPLERAVWWIEHVLRHGGARHLRAPAANMSWREYLELDLVLTLLAGILTLLVLSLLTLYHVYKFVINTISPNSKLKSS